MEKVIFLDIDGVLTPTMYNNALYKMWKNNNECKSRDDFGDYFSPWAVDYLYKIINDTSAKIVISSTWRMSGLKHMREMWEYRRLPGDVISITPECTEVIKNGNDMIYYDSVCRGHEINMWMEMRNFTGNYVIIDDTPDMLLDQEPFFVKTNDRIGLTLADANKCIEILNKKNNG